MVTKAPTRLSADERAARFSRRRSRSSASAATRPPAPARSPSARGSHSRTSTRCSPTSGRCSLPPTMTSRPGCGGSWPTQSPARTGWRPGSRRWGRPIWAYWRSAIRSGSSSSATPPAADPEIGPSVRAGFESVWDTVGRLSGADEDQVREFMATGMLLNVAAMLELPGNYCGAEG